MRLLVVLVLLCIPACEPHEGAQPEQHPLTIRVHPDHATVRLSEASELLTAVITQAGPLATFELPPGSYRYEVSAEGYTPFVGVFEIPKNRNLEVWLSP